MADRSGHWISESKRAAIYEANALKCAYCGKRCRETNNRHDALGITLDHVVARELGGNNAATNLVIACRRCNGAKRDMTLRGFLVYLAAQKVNVAGVATRVRKQLVNGAKIEARYGYRAGKPQFAKAA